MFSLPCLSDLKTPIVWKTWWASFVYPHFKGVEGDLGMFQGQFSKQYPFLNRKGKRVNKRKLFEDVTFI